MPDSIEHSSSELETTVSDPVTATEADQASSSPGLSVDEMNFETLVLQPLNGTLTGMLEGLIAALPSLIHGLIILIVGWIIALVLSKIIGGTLERIGFDGILEKVGVSKLLQRLGITGSVTQILAKAIFWVVILFIVRSASEALGMEDISALVEKIFAFLPRAITAAIILLVGFMAADVIQNAVFARLDGLGIRYAKTLAGLIFGFIIVLVLTVALPQLGVETKLLNATVAIIVGGIALALALALGLGLRELARNIVAGVYARDVYQSGAEIEVDGKSYRLGGIGPVSAKCITDDGSFVVVPNNKLILETTFARRADVDDFED